MPAIRTAVGARALERRARVRYPLEFTVRYRILSGRPSLIGTGHTLNVSSGGLLIASDQHVVQDGSRLQVHVEWPSRLDDTTALQLVAICRVIRCQPAGFAVRMERHQFHTRKV